MKRTLWRAAATDDPHFGFGSFWALTRSDAEWFAGWLKRPEVEERIGVQTTALYSVDVDMAETETLDLRDARCFIASHALMARARAFADAGTRWLIFYEGITDGRAWPQVIYLGDGSLPATDSS